MNKSCVAACQKSVRMTVESVSGCSWNECPDQRGITVRMRVEWVSESAWNPHREFYLPHIKTDRYLLHQIKAGNIQIRLTRLHGSIRAAPVIFLHDLAQYLDALAPSAPPSRDN